MWKVLALSIFFSFSVQAADFPTIEKAKGTDLADCELTLREDGRKFVTTILRERLDHVQEQNSFVQVQPGVKAEALKRFNLNPNSPSFFSLRLITDENDQYIAQLRDVALGLLSAQIDSDPIFVWRELDMNGFNDIVGRGLGPLFDFDEFSERTRNGYTYGSRAGLDGANGGRFVSVQHMTQNSVRLNFGLDVACPEIHRFIEPGTASKFLVLFDPKPMYLCRVLVLTADFSWGPPSKTPATDHP